MLVLLHPEVAYRDCGDCQKWLYEDSGAKAVYPGSDTPIPRPPGTSTPCRVKGKGCPKGTPDAMRSLTPQNQRCYEHHLECKETNTWPDDAIVRRHARIIGSLIEQAKRMREQRLTMLIEASLRMH